MFVVIDLFKQLEHELKVQYCNKDFFFLAKNQSNTALCNLLFTQFTSVNVSQHRIKGKGVITALVAWIPVFPSAVTCMTYVDGDALTLDAYDHI